MAQITDISKDNFDTDVLGADNLILVYYHAAWCKPCKKAEEIVQAGADEVDGKMRFVRVNTDQEPEIVTQQKVFTIPHFQIFYKGKVIESLNGVPSKLELFGMLTNAVSEYAQEEAPEKE